jgi:ribonuclease BN (tRNA processing enzyme)
MTSTANHVRVTVLGSGDAFGSGGRLQSSYLVEGRSGTFLMDCGSTVLSSLKRQGVDTGSIDFVLISHLHGDHFGGLPFLLLEYLYENPRRRPLIVAGPPGLAERVGAVFAGLYKEAAATTLPFTLEFRELAPGRDEIIGGVAVHPFRVPHQTTCVSLGLRVGVDGRQILYSGDSAWSEEFVSESRGTDLFLCECFLLDTRVEYHMNYRDLAQQVPRLGCKRLLLTHLGREFLDGRTDATIDCAEDGTVVLL